MFWRRKNKEKEKKEIEDRQTAMDNLDSIMSGIGIEKDEKAPDIINLSDDVDEADVVYYSRVKDWIKFLWLIPIIVALIAIFMGALFLTQVKVVPLPVLGSSHDIGNYSIVPKEYKVKDIDIKKGKKVVVGDKNSFIGPVLARYDLLEVDDRSKVSITVRSDDGKSVKKIPIYDIIYVLE